MKPFDFEEHKEDIKKKIDALLAADGITDRKGFTILEGFIAPVIKPLIEEYLTPDGYAFPIVVVYANSTGRLYQYSLKHLYPDEEVL